MTILPISSPLSVSIVGSIISRVRDSCSCSSPAPVLKEHEQRAEYGCRDDFPPAVTAVERFKACGNDAPRIADSQEAAGNEPVEFQRR